MTLRALLSALILSAAAAASYAGSPYATVEAVEERLGTRELWPAEGVWHFPSTGAVIAVERDFRAESERYTLTVIRSPRRSIRPGTVMGHFTATGARDTFRGRLMTATDGGSRLTAPLDFTFTLSDGGSRLLIARPKVRFSLSPWRLIPYLSKTGIRGSLWLPDAPEGCVKLFPPTGAAPEKPVYL